MSQQEHDRSITEMLSSSVCFSEEALRNKSSFSHLPMDLALARVENGSVLMAEMAKIFQARLDVEDREIGFSIRVSRPNLYELEIPSSTAEKALGYMKNFYLFLSREQATYRRSLDEDLISELEENRLKRLNQVTEHKNNITESSEEASQASTNLTKAKQNYIKVLDEVEVVRQKLSVATANLNAIRNMTEAEKKKKKEEESKYTMGRFLSAFDRTPEDECKHQSKKLKKLEADLVVKQQDIEEKKSILLEKIQKKECFYAQATVAFEKAESDRLVHTEKALRQFCTIEKQALEARIRLLESFENEAVEKLQSLSDMEQFATKHRNVDTTRMFSNALRMMEWDYKARMGGSSTGSDGNLHSDKANPSSGARRDTVWADVDGDSDMQTEMRSLHHDPEFSGLEDDHGDSLAAERAAVEEEVSRIIDEHYDEKPSLQYLFSKLKKKVEDVNDKPENLKDEKIDETVSSSNSDDSEKNPLVDAPENNEKTSETCKDTEVDIDSDNKSEDSYSAEETRVLLCVTILNETIFPADKSATSVVENEKKESNVISELEKRRVHCLSTVGFSLDCGRNAFLQILDDKRGRFSTLDSRSFEIMTITMKIFLDKCIAPRRVKSALRLANMSITFHKLLPVLDKASASQPEKYYVQRESEINQHELWHTAGFWDDALSNGLREQMAMMEPVQWDELEPEMLNEKVAAIHNILFGQLGTLAFTMHEMGLEKSYVQALIMNMGKASQLGEDLQLELFKSIAISYEDGEANCSVTSKSGTDTAKIISDSGGVKVSSVNNEVDPHGLGILDKPKVSDVKGLL